MIPRPLIPLLLGSLAAVILSGCAAAPPVVLASAGLSVAQVGAAAYVNGELQIAAAVPFDLTASAVRDTVTDLDLPVRDERPNARGLYVLTELSDGRDVGIQLKSLSPTITKIKIRVGVWGDQAVSRLLMGQIEERLRPFFDTPDTEPPAPDHAEP